jgi:aminoglycoside 3-N-acetyltransferase
VTPLDPVYAPRRIDHRSRDDLRTFLWQDFDAAGILRQGKVGQAGSWYVESQAFYNRLHDLMQHGITIYAEADELVRFQQLARG